MSVLVRLKVEDNFIDFLFLAFKKIILLAIDPRSVNGGFFYYFYNIANNL